MRIAIRLNAGDADKASNLALRLPGQPSRRGHWHYSPRPLSDALVVAIATAHPYVEDGLNGLPQLIKQSAAIGLWRLTVAATLTKAEQRVILTELERDLFVILTEENVAWHAPWRFEVALELARALLNGDHQADNLIMLSQQREDFAARVHGLARADRDSVPYEGKGGAAVWRAERELTRTQIARWLTSDQPASKVATIQPGWALVAPPDWRATSYKHGQVLAPEHEADLNEGRTLQIFDGSRSAIWPYGPDGSPVPRFNLILTATQQRSAADVVELVLIRDDYVSSPWVPVELAVRWQLLSPRDGDDLVAQAEQNRRLALHQRTARPRKKLDVVYDKLRLLVDQPEQFSRLAWQQGIPGGPFQAGCSWSVGSIAGVMATDATDEQLIWLVGALQKIRTRQLEKSMQRASTAAHWLGNPRPEDIV